MRNEDLNRILITRYNRKDFGFKMNGVDLLDTLNLPMDHIWFLKNRGYVNSDEGEGWKACLTLEGQYFIMNGGFKDETKTNSSNTINIGGNVINSQLNQPSHLQNFLPTLNESNNTTTITTQDNQKKASPVSSFIKLISENPLISGILATLIAGLIIFIIKDTFYKFYFISSYFISYFSF